VSKAFRNVRALLPLDADVLRGSSFALIGPNGAGKTTLMKIVLGLVRPDRGTVEINGLPHSSPCSRKGVRYLPERVEFPGWATPKVLFRQIERVRSEASFPEFESMCTRMECSDLMNRPLGKMSKGQRQRIAFSIVTCGNPRLLLLDEPSTGLDPGGRIMVRNMIRKMTSEGTTVMLNSHLLGEVERVCSTVAFIARGELVAQGALNEMTLFKGQAMVRTDRGEAMLPELTAAGYACTAVEGGVRVALPDMSGFRELTGRVLETGVEFTGVELQREDLEDVFMRIVEGNGSVLEQP
jgi:ABC-2 type transport system ATP-binding protein